MTKTAQWSVCEISDADEPGDHVLVGMRHRDFDGVLLLLVPDGDPSDTDWYGTPRTNDGRPTRPLLLFYKGQPSSEADALTWLENRTEEASTWLPFPDTFCDPPSPEAVGSVAVHLNYPPFPWLEAAQLGMRWGHYFDDVELVDWTEPTQDAPGTYTFTFSRLPKTGEQDGMV